MVGLQDQPVRDQLNRHRRVGRKDLGEQGGHGSQVINDDDGNAHIGRQMPQQAGVGVKATGRSAHANDRKSSLQIHSLFREGSEDTQHLLGFSACAAEGAQKMTTNGDIRKTRRLREAGTARR